MHSPLRLFRASGGLFGCFCVSSHLREGGGRTARRKMRSWGHCTMTNSFRVNRGMRAASRLITGQYASSIESKVHHRREAA